MTFDLRRLSMAAALSACTALIAPAHAIELKEIARFDHNVFDESAAEIIAFHPGSKSMYVVNGNDDSIDVFAIGGSDAGSATLTKTGTLALEDGENPNSVAVHGDLIAAAVAGSKKKGRPGKVVFFNADGNRIRDVAVGALPDMIAFTPDGKKVLTANEGEPYEGSEDGEHPAIDPEGSISIIDVSEVTNGVSAENLDFKSFSADDLRAKGVRLFPDKEPGTDLEPEYITISGDGKTAWVTLQEANALAIVDVARKRVTDIVSLGVKDHSLERNGLDSNDKASPGDIRPHPFFGLYMPDGIASYEVGGKTYLITANEGDAREEDTRLGKVNLDPSAMTAEQRALAGDRIKTSGIDGDTDGDGDIDKVHTYGARSFTIWDDSGKLVFDSGNEIEVKTLQILGAKAFNSHNEENDSSDSRSDDKGPEPEDVEIAELGGKTYAFIGLERVGGVMVYDVSDPAAPSFAHYFNGRNFDPSLDAAGDDLTKIKDLGPEGVTFISADDSPFGVPLLAVAYEVSGSIGLYEIKL